MPKPSTAIARPHIVISQTDAERLSLLAERAAGATAELMGELERADVLPDRKVPANRVGMNSTVEFLDEASGAERKVRLVYPAEADIGCAKVSITSLVGAALLGLCEGQSIDWPDRDGRMRRLKVLTVAREPG